MENSMEVPLKIRSRLDPVIPLLGIYLEKTLIKKKKYMYLSGHSSAIYNNQEMEAT